MAQQRYPTGPYTIALEGIDGCGKSTHCQLLANRIKAAGQKTLFTRQPGGTPALDIRDILLWQSDLHNKVRHLLYAADNAQHIHDTVKPALADNSVVIMDRAIGSSYAYQGWGEGFGMERTKLTYLWAIDGFEPDLTIFLNLSPEGVAKRRALEGQGELPLDIVEMRPSDYHERVYTGYCELVKMFDSWVDVPVEAETSVDQASEAIDDAIEAHLGR